MTLLTKGLNVNNILEFWSEAGNIIELEEETEETGKFVKVFKVFI